jgi:hypothetical protein
MGINAHDAEVAVGVNVELGVRNEPAGEDGRTAYGTVGVDDDTSIRLDGWVLWSLSV